MVLRDKALFSLNKEVVYVFVSNRRRPPQGAENRPHPERALIGVTVSYLHASGVSRSTSDALMARATNEANEAQTAVYRLTQSSGTNTMTLLSNVRSHIYALQCLNTLAANIYGAGTVIVDGSMLTACIATLDTAEQRLQAGNVLTGSMTELRDEVDAIVALFSAMENAEN